MHEQNIWFLIAQLQDSNGKRDDSFLFIYFYFRCWYACLHTTKNKNCLPQHNQHSHYSRKSDNDFFLFRSKRIKEKMDPIKWNDKTMCVCYDEKKETIHCGSDVKLKQHTNSWQSNEKHQHFIRLVNLMSVLTDFESPMLTLARTHTDHKWTANRHRSINTLPILQISLFPSL